MEESELALAIANKAGQLADAMIEQQKILKDIAGSLREYADSQAAALKSYQNGVRGELAFDPSEAPQ